METTVIDSADSPAGFRGGKGTPDAKVGNGAVVFDVPAGKTSFFALALDDVSLDLAEYAGIGFWWKVEGDGLASLTLKTRFPTMHEGRMLVFPLWRKGIFPAPREWIPAIARFAERGGMQGEPSGTRVIEFRVQVDRDADLRLFVDHVVALGATFGVSGDSAERRDDGTWEVPLEISNDSMAEIAVDYGLSGTEAVGTIPVPARGTVSVRLPLNVEPDAMADLPPLGCITREYWVEIAGVPLTRTRGVKSW